MKYRITIISILLSYISFADTIMPPQPVMDNGARSSTPPGQQMPIDNGIYILFLAMILLSLYFIYNKKRAY